MTTKDNSKNTGRLEYTFDSDEQGDYIRFFDGREPIRDNGNNNLAQFFHKELVEKTPPTTEDVMVLDKILKDYRQALSQQMGYILSGRHRLDIKTANKILLETAKSKLTKYILANYTPNTKVEQQVLIGRLDEQAHTSADVDGNLEYWPDGVTVISQLERLTQLNNQIKELDKH